MDDTEMLQIVEKMIVDKLKPINEKLEELEKRLEEVEDILATIFRSNNYYMLADSC